MATNLFKPNEDEQTNLLRQISADISGKQMIIPPEMVRFAYCKTGSESLVTTLFNEHNIIPVPVHDALQDGIKEFIFSCPEDVYNTMLEKVVNLPLAIHLSEKRMPVTGSVGSPYITVNQINSPATLVNGAFTMTSGTGESIVASATPITRIFIMANYTNSNVLLVGNATSQNVPLYAGDGLVLEVNDAALIYISGTVGEGITYIGA